MAHISCRPWVLGEEDRAGCFVVCDKHAVRQSFGTSHAVAVAACREHNRLHHPPVQQPKLLSLIYESLAASGQNNLDLTALLQESQENNRTFGVTGMLLEEDGWFLQALEGPELIVESLMATIARDPRHRHVRILQREFRAGRRFPDWAMARGHMSDVEALPLAEYYEAMLTVRGRSLAAAATAELAYQVLVEDDQDDNQESYSIREAA